MINEADGTKSDRAIGRLIVSFLLDFLRDGAAIQGRHDLGLIFSLVVLANIEVSTDGPAASTYANRPVPDDLRRPVSAISISQELGIPRETVRRQVAELVLLGAMVRVGRNGVIVPLSYLVRPEITAFRRRIIRSFLTLVVRMTDTGFTWPVFRREEGTESLGVEIPEFLLMRCILTFALRVVRCAISIHGSLESALIAEAACEFNVRDITDHQLLSRRYASSARDGPPDILRRPAPTRVLVARTGIPTPTVNRAIRRAVEKGDLVRSNGGVLMPLAVVDRPDRVQLRLQTATYFLSLVNRLATLGIGAEELTAWSGQMASQANS